MNPGKAMRWFLKLLLNMTFSDPDSQNNSCVKSDMKEREKYTPSVWTYWKLNGSRGGHAYSLEEAMHTLEEGQSENGNKMPPQYEK